jgi:hypothetical protein
MRHPVPRADLPVELYERFRRNAKAMNQPVEKAIVEIIRAATRATQATKSSEYLYICSII